MVALRSPCPGLGREKTGTARVADAPVGASSGGRRTGSRATSPRGDGSWRGIAEFVTARPKVQKGRCHLSGASLS